MKSYSKLFLCAILLVGLIGCEHKPIRTVRMFNCFLYMNFNTSKQDLIPIYYLEISDTGNARCIVSEWGKSKKMYVILNLSDSLKQRWLELACNDSIYQPYPWEKSSNPPNHVLFNIELKNDTSVKRCSYYHYASNKRQQELLSEFERLCSEVCVNYRYIQLNTKFDINDFVEQTKQHIPEKIIELPALKVSKIK